MKKRYAYFTLLFLFFATSAFVIYRFNKNVQKTKFYYLKERRAKLQNDEWKETKKLWTKYETVTDQNPNDIKNRLALSMLYIQEGRITGDHIYYDAAALHYIHQILQIEPDNFDALTLQSLIELSQHHFTDGLNTALKAQSINPYNAFVYGLLVDGNVETGNYKAAVENSDKMVSIRPDMRSYSRISYLREIHGDYKGAIEAMQMAVGAGIPGDESTEWSRIQLAKLYEEAGDLKKAEALYNLSLSFRPNYAYALAGLGHLAMCAGNYQKAIDYYLKADSLVNDYSIKEQLTKLYILSGDKEKSKTYVDALIDGLTKDEKQGLDDENIGHYADRELAYAYLLENNYDKALQHAIAEYNRRPDNIDVNETVAWVYYKKDEAKNSLPYIEVALKTNCKNPALLAHVGLIYAKANQKRKAKMLLTEALQNNPDIDVELKKEAATTLQTL
jgi:tetratricopeptide (TPR) repeat protein